MDLVMKTGEKGANAIGGPVGCKIPHIGGTTHRRNF